MPKAYAVVCYHLAPDPQKFAAYVKLASAAVAPFGARYLARSTASAAYEDGLRERTVIAEYPSLEKAIAARESDDTIAERFQRFPVGRRRYYCLSVLSTTRASLRRAREDELNR